MAEHKSLWAALLAFKQECPTLPKDKTNPHFKSKFTSLDAIAEKIDPILLKHGLVWVTLPSHHDGHPTLDYRLAHAASGEVLSGTMPLLLDRENSQGLGSAQTYGRRYAKVAVLDLVADEDDDGHAASSQPVRSQSRGATTGLASEKQRKLINVRRDQAGLSPVDFANAILIASGRPARDFDTLDAAEVWASKALERLPGKLVNPVLEAISNLAEGPVPA